MVAAATGRSASDPAALVGVHLPSFLVAGAELIFLERVGVQVDDLQARVMRHKVAERHPELAVVVERQAHLLLVLVRNELPFGRPAVANTFQLDWLHLRSNHGLLTDRSRLPSIRPRCPTDCGCESWGSGRTCAACGSPSA